MHVSALDGDQAPKLLQRFQMILDSQIDESVIVTAGTRASADDEQGR